MKDGLKNVLVLMSIVIGVAVTLLGLAQMTWSTGSPFAWGTIYLDAVFISILLGALALKAISRTFTVNRFIAGGGLALLIAVVTGNIWSLLLVLWFALAWYTTGRAILALLKIDKEQIPDITATLVGAAAYGTAVGLDGVVVDGACLPTLPEKSHTLTIVENADRIGRRLAMELSQI